MSAEKSAPLNAAVREIWHRARATVEGDVEQVEAAATGLLLGLLDERTRKEGERAAHKLAGSAGIFGFPRASETAARIERMLDAPIPADAALLAELALSLRTQLLGSQAESGETGSANESRAAADLPASARALVLTWDDALGAAIAVAASALGISPHVVRTEADAVRLLERVGCAVVLIDAVTADNHVREVVERVAHVHNVPVIIAGAAGGLEGRLAALRQGARGWVERRDPKLIAEQLAEQIDPPHRPRVIAIDDDLLIREHVGALLTAHGMDVELTANARDFWDALDREPADIALLDVDMPEVNGIELCTVLRQHPRHRTMPVIVLTAHRDSETVNRAFRAGADDFISKPVLDAELLLRIRNRLDRLELLRRLTETDPLTGLDNRAFSEQKLQHILRSSGPDGGLMLALINVDNFASVNLRYGRAIGDSVLREFALRMRAHAAPQDVVARWGGDEFVWAAGDATSALTERLSAFLQHLNAAPIPAAAGDIPVRFTAGVSTASRAGIDVDAIYGAAELAVADGKRRGGNRITPAEGESRLSDTVDVLIIDDDALVRELLAHTLKARGYTVRTLDDGQEASNVLLKERSLRPRVVLLDVDLPGLDGIALLRRLGEDGALDRMRVIMLTARSSEPEIVKALELDAFDHIAKPFSIAVLIQRVRRALLGL